MSHLLPKVVEKGDLVTELTADPVGHLFETGDARAQLVEVVVLLLQHGLLVREEAWGVGAGVFAAPKEVLGEATVAARRLRGASRYNKRGGESVSYVVYVCMQVAGKSLNT